MRLKSACESVFFLACDFRRRWIGWAVKKMVTFGGRKTMNDDDKHKIYHFTSPFAKWSQSKQLSRVNENFVNKEVCQQRRQKE